MQVLLGHLPDSLSRVASTLNTLINPTFKATRPLWNNHPFVQRMEADPGFEEIASLSSKLSTLAILDVGRRTWLRKNRTLLISAFCLGSHHTGYTNLIHGGVLAALIDEVCAEYCNLGAPSLYPLTRHLSVEFEKPSPPGELFIAKVSTSQPFPFIHGIRKVWMECEIGILQGDDRVIPVVKARALFVFCKSLPRLRTCGETAESVEDLFTRTGDGTGSEVIYLSSRFKLWWALIFIASILMVRFWIEHMIYLLT
jgi:acyl-coenzyme A thioesterase PaaI-like protein